jgi:hypothetical protein
MRLNRFPHQLQDLTKKLGGGGSSCSSTVTESNERLSPPRNPPTSDLPTLQPCNNTVNTPQPIPTSQPCPAPPLSFIMHACVAPTSTHLHPMTKADHHHAALTPPLSTTCITNVPYQPPSYPLAQLQPLNTIAHSRTLHLQRLI